MTVRISTSWTQEWEVPRVALLRMDAKILLGLGRSWAMRCRWRRQALQVALHTGEQHRALLKPKGSLGPRRSRLDHGWVQSLCVSLQHPGRFQTRPYE